MGGTVYVGTFSRPRLVNTRRGGERLGMRNHFEVDFAHVDSVEKRNKHARVLAAPQALGLKKWRRFCQSSCKPNELRTLCAFQIFPVSSNIFSSLMES